ncbi:hypothetical protein [Paracoccus sulfuroxidans]|uniref:Lipoprotein n=1 Tax=Paracoccus sulfuroxidans TaxID=384678 RepID=A0A562NS77_9RHOB|nr:hypothetical protein [Paracoccus sulfuroxidans]TWI35052.1 hypothetical protein IQ24_01561 [Paracoccus sulfuroxidans]
MKRMLISALVLLGLAACATDGEDYAKAIANSVSPSAELKANIVKDAQQIIYDPASIRDAEISNLATLSDGTQGICVRADSKNVSGVYVGVHNMGVKIENQKPDGAALEHPLCNRPDVKWNPFPELERMKSK